MLAPDVDRSAACPSCGTRIDLGVAPPATGSCSACSARFLVVVAEPEAAPGAPAFELLPLTAHAERRERLARPAKHVTLLVLAAVFVLPLLVVAALGVGELWPRMARVAALTATPLVLLPFVVVFAALAARFVLPSRGPAARAVFWQSVFVLAVGATVLGWSVFLAPGLATLLGSYWLAVVLAWSAPLAAGWVTARLARRAPYRHVLGVVCVFVATLAVVCLPFGWPAVGALGYLLLVPFLLAGAWLALRFGAAAPRGA